MNSTILLQLLQIISIVFERIKEKKKTKIAELIKCALNLFDVGKSARMYVFISIASSNQYCVLFRYNCNVTCSLCMSFRDRNIAQ